MAPVFLVVAARAAGQGEIRDLVVDKTGRAQLARRLKEKVARLFFSRQTDFSRPYHALKAASFLRGSVGSTTGARGLKRGRAPASRASLLSSVPAGRTSGRDRCLKTRRPSPPQRRGRPLRRHACARGRQAPCRRRTGRRYSAGCTPRDFKHRQPPARPRRPGLPLS